VSLHDCWPNTATTVACQKTPPPTELQNAGTITTLKKTWQFMFVCKSG